MVSGIHDSQLSHAVDHDDECPTCGEPVPGVELPNGIYYAVLFAFVWMLLASWYAFASDGEADFVLVVASGLFAAALTIPLLLRRTARRHEAASGTPPPFRDGGLDTATGLLPAREVWLQITLIPAGLALAASLIGLVYVFTS